MDELNRFFDELQSMTYDKKVEYASNLVDQIIPQMNEIFGHAATEYEVFWFFGGLAAIPDIYNNYGLTSSTFKLFIDSLRRTKQNNLSFQSEDDFNYDSFKKDIYTMTKDMGSSYHVDGVFKQLEDEYKIKACFFMAVISASDGAMTKDERQLVTYFFINGTWNYGTDIWANEPKTSSVFVQQETNNNDSYANNVTTPKYTFTANNEYVNSDEGSYILGVILVIFLNWIGLIIAVVMRKRKTTKGAIIAFIVYIVFNALLIIVLASTGIIQKLTETTEDFMLF